MKRSLIFVMSLFILSSLPLGDAAAQNFTGFHTSRYAGATGMFNNPASIADSTYKWDFSLGSLSAVLSNNSFGYKLSDLTTVGSDTTAVETLIPNLSTLQLSGETALQITGPSICFKLGKIGAIGLSSRFRTQIYFQDFDTHVVGNLQNLDASAFPFTINGPKDMQMAANVWSDFGLTYAREVFNTQSHTLRVGGSVHYIIGTGNAYARLTGLKGTVNVDSSGEFYARDATGTLAIGMGGQADVFTDAGTEELNLFSGRGLGFDLGVQYEYRRLVEQPATQDPNHPEVVKKNPYIFKVGIALRDMGSVRYNADAKRNATVDIHTPAGDNWYFVQELDSVEMGELTDYFQQNPSRFTLQSPVTDGSYRTSLPTALQLEADYCIRKNIYVNATGVLPMQQSLKNGAARAFSRWTLTPRYENRWLGIFVPIGYHELSGFNAGLALRLGPVFMGSASILSAMGNSKQADFYFGIKLGSLR